MHHELEATARARALKHSRGPRAGAGMGKFGSARFKGRVDERAEGIIWQRRAAL